MATHDFEALYQRFTRAHGWTLMADPTTLAAFRRRWEKALALPVAVLDPGTKAVTSGTDPSVTYTVTADTCTCPDYRRAPFGWCKHRLSVWQWDQYLADIYTDERKGDDEAEAARIAKLESDLKELY